MAKDLVFDSDRYEKRQRIKRWLIPAAALLAVIVIAAAAALLLRSRQGKPFTGGEDTPYPYRWTENANGSVSLELDRSAAPGYEWVCPEENPAVTVESRRGENANVFTLTPREEGRQVLQFFLRRGEDGSDRLCELSVLVQVSAEGKKLSAALSGFGAKQFFASIRGGEDTPFPYLLSQDEDGDVMLVVTDPTALVPKEAGAPEEIQLTEEDEAAGQSLLPEEAGAPEEIPLTGEDGAAGHSLLPGAGEADAVRYNWQCESGDEGVAAVLGVISAGDVITAYLRPGTAPGTTWVRMYNEGSGAALTLEVEADGNGALLVLSHSMSVGEAAVG